ncbi:neuroligin-2-like isoform X2 [Amphibalanus amphitrite]|uniref:neuroligin-2-like isoform X2 n=1 Tax=Amphibalanus amphitrite TaxID=1232801 RepID=UPI001C918A59|nr:neuroligin-2-like isoform X2 [Amphibalanus amphitrite]
MRPVSRTSQAGETARARYPVMVYVHGESFSYGSGNALDGSVLASFGAVVVVTLNYRLGVLGFLNSNLEPVRAVANYGLLDIVAALEFVRLTVAAFGGDPTNVTVFSHGAGAACINFLMTSASAPLGLLFHRVILMSGSSLSPWALLSNPLNATVQLAAGVNCTATQSALLPCLRSRPLSALLAAPVVAPRFLPPFGPSLDGIVINDELFTRRASYAHRLVSYRVLAGVTAADADQQLSESQLSDGVTAAQRDSTLRTYVQNTYSYHLNELVSVVRHDYTDWSRGQQPPRRLRDQLVHALSDAQYVAPVTRTVDMYPDDQNTYFYVFNGGSDYSDGKKAPRLSHGSELPFVFGAPLVYRLGYFSGPWTDEQRALSETLMAFWTNFAKSGDPNKPKDVYVKGGGDDRHRKIIWSPYEQMYKKYMALGRSPRVLSHYRSQSVALWLRLVPEIHRRGTTGLPGAAHHQFDEAGPPPLYAGPVRSVPATWRPLPPAVTTAASDTNASAVLDGSLGGGGGPTEGAPPAAAGPGPGAGTFSAYSTALSVTVAIGCSLLVLNILILAGVYYQREKGRAESRKRSENGPVCGGTFHAVSSAGGERHSLKLEAGGPVRSSGRSSMQAALPPAEFADLPPPAVLDGVCSRSVPRPPPPPRGHSRPPDEAPMLERHMMVAATLPRNVSRGALRSSGGSSSRCSSQEQLSELRV